MQFIDTHTHIYYEAGSFELEAQIQRAMAKSITKLLLPSINTAYLPAVIGTAQSFPHNCFPMVGLHPCEVRAEDNEKGQAFHNELASLYAAIQQHKFYAIGEAGIDLHWDKNTLAIQKEAFQTQIHWAKAFKLPLVIHCRNAFDEVYQILMEEKDDNLQGVFHCFGGSLEQAQQIIELGFYLGIGGILTYKNAGLDAVIKDIDLKHIVLETDAPYLSPTPHRGKPNESSFLIYIAQKLADIKEVPIEKLAEITTENAKSVFKIL